MSTLDTRTIVVDYVQHQLRKKGLLWRGHPPLDESAASVAPGKVEQTMRLLGEEFEQRYTKVSVLTLVGRTVTRRRENGKNYNQQLLRSKKWKFAF
jgi:Bcl-2 homology region 4